MAAVPTAHRSGRPRRAGFTLIELVVVITLSAIVVTFMARFLLTPVEAYAAQSQRAQLADAADGALRLLSRDLRAALPNSVRVTSSGTVTALELLATLDGARYRDNGPLTDPTQWLDFSQAEGAFATTVPFSQVTLPYTSTSNYLAIYNIGITGANAYALANVITPVGTTISITGGSSPNAQNVTLSPAFQFSYSSPGKRVYLVSGPVSYLCDTSTGYLTRYSGYAISSTQAASAATLAAAGATAGRVASNVSLCQFTYAAGTAQRSAMATLTLQLSTGGQQVQLVHQVHLVNVP